MFGSQTQLALSGHIKTWIVGIAHGDILAAVMRIIENLLIIAIALAMPGVEMSINCRSFKSFENEVVDIFPSSYGIVLS